MSIFIMCFLFSIFLFFYLVFSVENMAINWDKEVKIMTKGLKLGKRTALDVWDQVVILGSKRYPHWNRRTGFIVRGLNKRGEYFVALKDEYGRASYESNKRGWIAWLDVCSYVEDEMEHKSVKEADEYADYIYGHQIDRNYCGYCQKSKKKVKLKGCGGCADIKEIFRIKYCGRKCQKKDWQRHSTICKRKGKEKYAPK